MGGKMTISFLGTGAAEGIPAPFCRCAVCENARKVGGKEIRMRMGVLIDNTLLIDFSPDAFAQAVHFGADYTALQALCVTHTHSDHFAVDDLVQRCPCNAKNRTVSCLRVLGNEEMARKLRTAIYDDEAAKSLSVEVIRSGESIPVGDYRVTALKSIHMENEESLIYLFSKGDTHYLHACDSAELLPEVFDFLKQHHIHLAGVTLDCTFGLLEEQFYGHMNYKQNLQMKRRLEEIGAADDETCFILTHISHFCRNTHEQIKKRAEQDGFMVAWDGMSVRL